MTCISSLIISFCLCFISSIRLTTDEHSISEAEEESSLDNNRLKFWKTEENQLLSPMLFAWSCNPALFEVFYFCVSNDKKVYPREHTPMNKHCSLKVPCPVTCNSFSREWTYAGEAILSKMFASLIIGAVPLRFRRKDTLARQDTSSKMFFIPCWLRSA